MKDIESAEVIEKYLSGLLDPDERDAFEKRLQSDPELAQQISSYRNVVVKQIFMGKDKIRNGLLAVGKKSSSLSRSIVNLDKKKNIVKIVGLCVISLICLCSAFFFLDKPPDHEVLFNQYYSQNLSSHPSVKNHELIETYGIEYFQNREYSRAIPALEKEIIAKPGEARLYLYLGISYLENNLVDKAKKNFEKAESLSEGSFRNSAIWYLALSEVKLNQISEARQSLRKLIKNSDDNPHKEVAASLLREL